MFDEILWFGYQYTDGNYQVKRYFEPVDIQEVQECVGNTVRWVYKRPFRANSREEALNSLKTFKTMEKIYTNSVLGCHAADFIKTYNILDVEV